MSILENRDTETSLKLAEHFNNLAVPDLDYERQKAIHDVLAALRNLLQSEAKSMNMRQGSTMSSQEGHLEKTHALEVTHNARLNTPLSEAKVTSEPEASASAPNEETQDQTNNLISETLVRRCLSKLEGLEQSLRRLEHRFRFLTSSVRVVQALDACIDSLYLVRNTFSTLLPLQVGTDPARCDELFSYKFPSFLDNCAALAHILDRYANICVSSINVNIGLYDVYDLGGAALDAHRLEANAIAETGKPWRLSKFLQAFCKRLDFLIQYVDELTVEGLPRIESTQHSLTSHIFHSTGLIAAFFSAVTATTIQLTYQDTETTLGAAVNTFMFASLVCSVSSVVNSVLVTKWRGSTVDAPEYVFPPILSIIFVEGPKAYVLLSGALFTTGMTLFLFSSHQSTVTQAIVTTLVALQSASILFFFVVFAKITVETDDTSPWTERWRAFRRGVASMHGLSKKLSRFDRKQQAV